MEFDFPHEKVNFAKRSIDLKPKCTLNSRARSLFNAQRYSFSVCNIVSDASRFLFLFFYFVIKSEVISGGEEEKNRESWTKCMSPDSKSKVELHFSRNANTFFLSIKKLNFEVKRESEHVGKWCNLMHFRKSVPLSKFNSRMPNQQKKADTTTISVCFVFFKSSRIDWSILIGFYAVFFEQNAITMSLICFVNDVRERKKNKDF